jgi:hypothetical protein
MHFSFYRYAVQARVTKTMINAVLKPDMAFVSQCVALRTPTLSRFPLPAKERAALFNGLGWLNFLGV